MKETPSQWKQPSLKSISSRCSPRHLHYSPLCCRCLATLLAIPHFVPIIHMVWLFDMRENWQITGWRAVTSQINVVTGAHENLGVWAVLLLGGLGRAKTNIIPTCCGLTLLAQTPVIDTHFCCGNHSRGAALGGQIPSLPSFVSIFSCMLFCLFAPSISFASETRRFHRVWNNPLPHPTFPAHLLPGSLCLIHPDWIEGAAGLPPGAPGWDDRPLINM